MRWSCLDGRSIQFCTAMVEYVRSLGIYAELARLLNLHKG